MGNRLKIEHFLSEETRRAESYKLLSECYHLPDEKLIRTLSGLKGSVEQPYSEIAGYAPKINGIELLRTDYSKLFVGPFRVLAPPYGSVYLERGRRIMGNSTMNAKKRYREEGLDVVIKEAPDHVAVELEFVHFLILKEVEAIRNSQWEEVATYLRKQGDFLGTHLGMWMSRFAEDIEKNAKTEFYRNLARIAKSFIEKDMVDIERIELSLDSYAMVKIG